MSARTRNRISSMRLRAALSLKDSQLMSDLESALCCGAEGSILWFAPKSDFKLYGNLLHADTYRSVAGTVIDSGMRASLENH